LITAGRSYRAALALLPFLILPVSAGTINLSINTAAVSGQNITVAFDIIANTQNLNFLDILNFSAPGATMGVPQTSGGLVTGDLILRLNPAPFTQIATGSFFNELLVNLTPVGNLITFQLSFTENGPSNSALPDNIALFLLNEAGLPLFPTSDPTGADSLLSVDLTGDPGGVLNVYSPATQTSPGNVQVTVPAQAGVPEPASFFLFSSGLLLLAIASAVRTLRHPR